VLEPLSLTVTDAASSLGASRKALSRILNGHAGISPEMAVRLSIAFNTSAECWLNQQLQYDLWQAEKNGSGSTWRDCLPPVSSVQSGKPAMRPTD
jgi:addiction module HigA family antidote